MRATKTYTAVVTVTVEYNSDGNTAAPDSEVVANAADASVVLDIADDESQHQPNDDSEIVGVSIDWNTLKPTA